MSCARTGKVCAHLVVRAVPPTPASVVGGVSWKSECSFVLAQAPLIDLGVDIACEKRATRRSALAPGETYGTHASAPLVLSFSEC